MIDEYGRKIEYVRISVTDRCNFRCIYCMPGGNILWQPKDEILTDAEIIRIASAFARLGIKRIKITGGEPLLRPGIEKLIGNIKKISGIETVTLTTNGVLLGQKLEALCAVGLDGVNISLDAVTPHTFERLTGCGGKAQLDAILTAIDRALSANGLMVKINCVPMKNINEADCAALIDYAKHYQMAVRFIEMMPIGIGGSFEPVTETELIKLIGVPIEPVSVSRDYGGGPCRYYRPAGFDGLIGFISAVSHKFCGSCNRVRLTSDGFLKTCLQYDCGTDLKAVLRSMPDSEVDLRLEQAIRSAIVEKPKEHHFEAMAHDSGDEQKNMFQIGG